MSAHEIHVFPETCSSLDWLVWLDDAALRVACVADVAAAADGVTAVAVLEGTQRAQGAL